MAAVTRCDEDTAAGREFQATGLPYGE